MCYGVMILQGCVGVIADVCRRAGGVQSSNAVTTPQPMTPHQPVSQPSTPLMPVVPFPSSLGLPPSGLPAGAAAGAGGEGGGLLEQFEASAQAQEAEDRLAQLLMDEELSDARLGGEDDDKHLQLHTQLAYLSSETTPTSVGESWTKGVMTESMPSDMGQESGMRDVAAVSETTPTSVGEESAMRDVAAGRDKEVMRGTGVLGAEGESSLASSLVTNYQSTHDPQEPQRLEQARTVAR